MATQKPISSISYNSEAFLVEKLETWKKAHIIQSYMYIKHKGEDGDKDHIHFRIEPNKKLDPMDLQEELKEYVGINPKPLGCRPFRPSKEEDWIMYAVHDKEYLQAKYGSAEKGEKLPYSWEDIKAPEDYDVEIAYIRAKSKLKHTSSNLAKQISSGKSALTMVSEGENPFVVGSLLRLMSATDYQRLAFEHSRLLQALNDAGLIWDMENNLILTSDGEIYGLPFEK